MAVVEERGVERAGRGREIGPGRDRPVGCFLRAPGRDHCARVRERLRQVRRAQRRPDVRLRRAVAVDLVALLDELDAQRGHPRTVVDERREAVARDVPDRIEDLERKRRAREAAIAGLGPHLARPEQQARRARVRPHEDVAIERHEVAAVGDEAQVDVREQGLDTIRGRVGVVGEEVEAVDADRSGEGRRRGGGRAHRHEVRVVQRRIGRGTPRVEVRSRQPGARGAGRLAEGLIRGGVRRDRDVAAATGREAAEQQGEDERATGSARVCS